MTQAPLIFRTHFHVLSDLRSPNEIGSDVFSPLQAPQATFSQTNGSDKRAKDAEDFFFPHELRRRKRLLQQQLYFEHMTEQIKEQRETECTIERVHQPSKETFVENYMNRGKPVILTGMMDSWDAMKSWDFKQLGNIKIIVKRLGRQHTWATFLLYSKELHSGLFFPFISLQISVSTKYHF